MSAYTDHESQQTQVRARYGKYEAQYNATIAADPNKADRKFDELAPPDAKQWARLETYRGNDRDARAEFMDHPNSATQPTAKEQRMWDANQAENWAIDREPDMYLDHPHSKNKWLDMSQQERRSERSQQFFEAVENKYGPTYEKWAQRAGSSVVDRDTYLQGLAVIADEAVRARQQQAQQTQETPSYVNAEQFMDEQIQAKSKLNLKQIDSFRDTQAKSFKSQNGETIEQAQGKVEQLIRISEMEKAEQEARRQEAVAERQSSRGLER